MPGYARSFRTAVARLSERVVVAGRHRHLLAASQSGRCLAAYLYAAAGQGEFSTDLAWDGHGMIAEARAWIRRSLKRPSG